MRVIPQKGFSVEKNMEIQPPVVILQQTKFFYLFCACGKESSEDPMKVFSS